MSAAATLIGHRGAPGYRPEHSQASYELAFAMGVDAVEPDVVSTQDGVLVVRHENEISGTTNVADHLEFASRRTTKRIDGREVTGWFTEDFTWNELSALRVRERFPAVRPGSAAFDDQQPLLRLVDLIVLIRDASRRHQRAIGLVLEIKHASYFRGLGLDLAFLVERDLRESGWTDGVLPLYIESFEQAALTDLQQLGLDATYIRLLTASGVGFTNRQRTAAPTLAAQITSDDLDRLAEGVDGISLDKATVLERPSIVADAQARGVQVFAWTCRPENAFLSAPFRSSADDTEFGNFIDEWRAVRDSGVDGVFFDHPDLAHQVFL